MSENTPSAEELVEEIDLTVSDASVIPMPIDPTLSNEGEAADAKATGDAIADVFNGAKVNNKAFSNKAVTIYAGDIAMSNAEGAQTVAEAITSVSSSTANDIMYDSVNLVSVKDAIDGIKDEIDTELTEEEIDAIIDEVFGEDDE